MRYLFILSGVVCLSLLALVVPHIDILWAQQDLEAKIIGMEESRWEGWKNHDAKPYEQYCAKDVVWVSRVGITTDKARLLEGASGGWDCDVTSYAFSDFKMHRFAGDTIIITYKASQDAICGGNKLPPVVYASTVYVKQGDSWLAAFHQETAAAE